MDSKIIEKNLRELAIPMCFANEEVDKRKLENFISDVKDMGNEWSFSELNDFYEEGLKLVKESILPYDLACVLVGYELLTRYDLSDDEYIEWAKKQERKKARLLLQLIGVTIPEYEEEAKRELEEQKTKEMNQRKEAILDELAQKSKLLKFSEISTGYTLVGRDIEISEEILRYSRSLKVLSGLHGYAQEILKKGFESRCTTYIETSKNIVGVLDDAIEAVWIKMKRFLKDEKIDDNEMNCIHTEFNTKIDLRLVKTKLDDAFKDLRMDLEDEIDDLQQECGVYSDRTIVSGGYGVDGLLASAVGAEIAKNISNLMDSTVTGFKARSIAARFNVAANELYRGEDRVKSYQNIIRVCVDILGRVVASKLVSEPIEKQSDGKEFVEELKELRDEFSPKEIKDIICDLLRIYPTEVSVYEYAISNIANIRSELLKIAEIFNISKDVNMLLGQIVGGTERRKLYTDLEVDISDNKKMILKTMEYNNINYEIDIPMEVDWFFDKEYSFYRYKGTCINQKFAYVNNDKAVFSIWGGKEGKEQFEKEVTESSRNILCRVNKWANVSIEDFDQEVDRSISDDHYQYIFRARLEKQYDVFMLLYADTNAYIVICFGEEKSINYNPDKFRKVVQNSEIIQCNTTEPKKLITKEEFIDLIQTERKQRAEKEFDKRAEDLNYIDTINIRRSFKKLYCIPNYAEGKIYKYDYEIRDKSILSMIERLPYCGHYILYASKNIMVTDGYVVFAEGINHYRIFRIRNIMDLFPTGKASISILMTDASLETVYIQKEAYDEIVTICDIVSMLQIAKNVEYIKIKYLIACQNVERIICEHCKTIGQPVYKRSMLFTKAYCPKCDSPKVDLILKDNFWKETYFKIAAYQKQLPADWDDNEGKEEKRDLELYRQRIRI